MEAERKLLEPEPSFLNVESCQIQWPRSSSQRPLSACKMGAKKLWSLEDRFLGSCYGI